MKSDNSLMSRIFKFCSCCLLCLEKFMKYMNSNAYTVIAIKGNSFCRSAQESFSIVFENALRITAINSIGDFILFLAKVAITTLILIISIAWLETPTNNVDFI